jgi:hypothetical protein
MLAAPGAANPVNVQFGLKCNVHVDHRFELSNIKSA